MPFSKRNIKRALVVYWILAAYIIIALVWWFIELSRQNNKIANIRLAELSESDVLYTKKKAEILKDKKSNTAQYLGEGSLFLILIITGATFVIRAFKKEMRSSANQQNFLMAITHELKTPIAVTKLNLETIQKHKLTDAQYQKILGNTLQETDRLDALCNNLLLSSQIDAGGYKINKEDIDFSLLTKECINGFITRQAYRTMEIKIASDLNVHGDAFLLQIAINNLIENALKYSPKDKPIGVALENINGNVVLQIIDEGAGIADEEKLDVFKKFYRTGNEATRRAKGTGLGLYLTQRIVSAHDGNIAIQNNPKGGSIFVVSLKTIA
jgi:two-component system, OmpR family, sensor histidine kinase CiaH